jgi:hypothetical protein
VRTGDDLDELGGDLLLQRGRERCRDKAPAKLLDNGHVNLDVSIPERDRSEAADPVYVLVPIDIPHPSSISTMEVGGIGPLDEAGGLLGHRLGPTRRDGAGRGGEGDTAGVVVGEVQWRLLPTVFGEKLVGRLHGAADSARQIVLPEKRPTTTVDLLGGQTAPVPRTYRSWDKRKWSICPHLVVNMKPFQR